MRFIFAVKLESLTVLMSRLRDTLGCCEKVSRFVETSESKTVSFDVAANVGYYSVRAVRRCKSVLAFEPFATNTKFLKRHFCSESFRELCRRLKLRSEILMAPSVAHLENRAMKGAPRIPAASVCPRSHRSHGSGHSGPNLIKIAVEGAKLNALNGARFCWQPYHPAIFSRDS
jgi:FkbM family methyltransferase